MARKGYIYWENTKKENIGFKENEEGDWEVYYGPVYLGVLKDTQLIQPQAVRKTSHYKCHIF